MYDQPQDQREEDRPAVAPEEFVAFVTQAQNLASELDDRRLPEIARQVIDDNQMDKSSMSGWFDKMERGLKLAQLVKEDRNYPFDGAANVKYPLVTSAALQFNARAYPAVVPPDRVVKAKVWGSDKGGMKAARAERVSEFQSWQLSAQIEEWEEETDKLLVQLPIVGTMVRKWWYDPIEKRPRCRLVDPGRFIVNDKVKSLKNSPRCGEEIPLYPSEIESRIRAGEFIEFDYEVPDEDDQAPQDFIEQHTMLDLDEDGLYEPYIVTVHKERQQVVRIVADFRPSDVIFQREQRQVAVPVPMVDQMTGITVTVPQIQTQEVVSGITAIRRGSYFVSFEFMPGMDGGFHGTGLGLLLGDISETINSIINMMLDAGHYASLGGGFIGSEFRMKGGGQRFRPGEWKTVQSKGGEIRNAMVPMTFPGPDATLFQMLGMLIDAGREIASVKDVMTGEQPRQQQTATTTLALIEQGMMVFTAAYQRIFRSLKKEYALLARMNAETLDAETYSRFHDEMSGVQQGPDGQQMQPQPVMLDPARDFDLSDMDIQPVADPRAVTKMQQAAKAQFVMQLAEMGLIDRGAALERIAEAMDIEDWEALLPKPDPMQQQMQAMQMQAAQADLADKAAKVQLTMAQVEETRAKTVEALASAQNEQARTAIEARKVQLDGLMKLLEDERERLASVLGAAGRMAGTSRDGAAARGNGQAPGSAQEGALGGLLGGQPGAGGNPAGGAFGGGMGL